GLLAAPLRESPRHRRRDRRGLHVLVVRRFCRSDGQLAQATAYSLSISSAYFASIGLRLSFIVGVSSSPDGSQTVGSTVYFLICSTRDSLVLASCTDFSMYSSTTGCCASSSWVPCRPCCSAKTCRASGSRA